MNNCDVRDVRRRRLAELIGDVARRGAVAEFARTHGLNDTYLRQLLNGHRSLGEKAARRMEREIGLSPKFLDGDEPTAMMFHEEAVDEYEAPRQTVSIPRYNMEASMGGGRVLESYQADVVERIDVSSEYLRRQVRFSAPENLVVITALGDSMSPTFNDCDLLLVDRGVKEVKLDAVYVIDYEGEIFVKRVQRRPGEPLLMISDNQAYQAQPITHKAGRFEILGRVLMAWIAKKL